MGKTVRFKGHWKACPPAFKIPLLQEGFPRMTQTLETLRKYIAKPDHIKLENFYVVKKKRNDKVGKYLPHIWENKEMCFLIQ